MSIFSRILEGSIPCHRVYEDDLTLAFLDINPLAPGHTLVIPKEAQATVMDLSEESAAGIGRVLPRISRAACAAAGVQECNIIQNNGAGAGQEVMHVHFHVIPKSSEFGLRKQWTPRPLADGEAEEILRIMQASVGQE